MSELAGLNALVTGGGRGIGAAIAAALTDKGVRVTVLGRDEAALAARIQAKEAAAYIRADVTDPSGFEAIMTRIAAEGAVDILVNNAGAAMSAPFLKTTNADFQRMLEVNLLGPVIAARAVLPGMIARKFGRVVNITSAAVKAPIEVLGLSNGARTGLTGFVAGLSRKTVIANVTINGLLPGPFDTDRLRGPVSKVDAEKRGITVDQLLAERAKLNPAGRFGDPEEFGLACAFLCGAKAGFITGQNILLDGGAFPGTL